MGASPLSLLIKTAKRDLKLTAPSLERHELWRMVSVSLAGHATNSFLVLLLVSFLPVDSSW